MRHLLVITAVLFILLSTISGSNDISTGFKIKNGEVVYVKTGQSLTNSKGFVSNFSVSPDGKFVVYVEGGMNEPDRLVMSIIEVQTRKLIIVGHYVITDAKIAKDLGYASEPPGKYVNGGYWDGFQLHVFGVSGDVKGMEFWLSMNGRLTGDV